MGALIFLFVGVFVGLIGAIVAQSDAMPGLVMILGGLAISVGTFRFMVKKTKKDHAKWEAQAAERAADEQRAKSAGTWQFPVKLFIDKCGDNRIHGIHSEADYQKAKLIAMSILDDHQVPKEAQAQYVTRQKLESYCAQLVQHEEAQKQARLQKELSDLRREEAALEAESTRYSQQIGRDKSIRYCEDKIEYYQALAAQCQQKIDEIMNKAAGRHSTMVQKETDWAIAGGIASGLAGGAAGLAAAADVQNQNAAKRQYNAQLTSNIITLAAYESQDLRATKDAAWKSISYWTEELNKAKLLLTQSLDEADLLKRLDPPVSHMEISKTGAVKMEIALRAATGFHIHETVPATVDGSIQAILKHDGKIAGTATFCVKYNGATTKHTVNCICTNPSVQAGKYDVSFAPNHLWAVEAH